MIAENYALFGVDHGYAFHHAAQNGAGAIALVGECANGIGEARGSLIQRADKIGELVFSIFELERAEIAAGHASGEIFEALDAR